MDASALTKTAAVGSVVALTLVGLTACDRSKRADSESTPVSQTTYTTGASIQKLDVPSDRSVLVSEGKRDEKRPLVFLHGMCTSPDSGLRAWGDIAREHGTIVALTGDVACPEPAGTARWSADTAALDKRIQAACTAARLDPSEVIVIGESMGATRAVQLATAYPERYKRLVLVGGPEPLEPGDFRAVSAVASLAGEKEPQANMQQGADTLYRAGVNARFWSLPGATHGEYGPDGARVMSEAVGFVAAR